MMNRKQRRALAREAAKSLHLKGTAKAAAVRALATQFRGVVVESAPPPEEQAGQQVAEQGSARIFRRKSGLLSVRSKGLES
jgi:hypothetical protein